MWFHAKKYHFSNEPEHDEWLRKSLAISEKSDPDYELVIDDLENEELKINMPKTSNFTENRVFLVYESQLNPLLNTCSKCGKPIIEKREMKLVGCNYRVKMECLDGCETTWSAQPSLSSTNGKMHFYRSTLALWLPC